MVREIEGYIEKAPLGHSSIVLHYKSRAKDIEVKISPYFGSNIYEFKYNGKNIFFTDTNRLQQRDWTGCFILWPFPNRVRGKKYEFDGKTYSLENIKRRRGNYPLVHGLVDNHIWQVGEIKKEGDLVKASTFIDVTPDSFIYKYFPFKSRLGLTFALGENGLKIEYKVENLSKTNLPFGFALHPYFSLLSGRDNTLIRIPAKSIMEQDEELLPTDNLIDVETTDNNLNKPMPVSKLSLDHVFTNLDRSYMPYIDYTDQKMCLYLESSRDFTHLVVYTKEEHFICLENQTCSTDAINLHTKGVKEHNPSLVEAAHLLILPPGQSHQGYVYYRIEEY